MIAAYLGGTPLAAFAETPLPFAIPREAPLRALPHRRRHRPRQDPIDANHDAGRLRRSGPAGRGRHRQPGRHDPHAVALARFDPALDDRLIILDPADTEWPLKLNLFDVNRGALDALPRGEREQILAGIIELYDYIFGALLGSELTAKQSVVFRFLAQLMLAIPDANIQTLRQLLEEMHDRRFPPYLAKLPAPRAPSSSNDSLRRRSASTPQTSSRCCAGSMTFSPIPTFERMFSHPKNALDMKRVAR